MIKETLVGLVQQLCPSVLRPPVNAAALEERLSYFPCLLSHYKEVLVCLMEAEVLCATVGELRVSMALGLFKGDNQLKVVQ
jgi:hypothetical protein